MAVETTTGASDHVVVLPGNTALPIVTAAVTGCFFVCLLAGQYWLSLLPLVGVAALGLRRAWVLDWRQDIGPLPIGRGEMAPIHREAAGAPGWWGSASLLVADGTALASLLFGYAFLWVIAPNWPPPERIAGLALLRLPRSASSDFEKRVPPPPRSRAPARCSSQARRLH